MNFKQFQNIDREMWGLDDIEPITPHLTVVQPTPAPKKKEVPFFPPTLHIPDWDGEIASLQSGYIITKSATPQATPFTDRTTPTVFFDLRVYLEATFIMQTLAKQSQEVALFFINKKINSKFPHFLIHDWFMTSQEVSSAEATVDMDDARRYYDHLKEQGIPGQGLHKRLIHTHSHHNMGLTSWSGVDTKQQTSTTDMGFLDDYKLFGLYTTKEEYMFSYIGYFPVYHRVEHCHIGIRLGEDPKASLEFPKTRKDELLNMIDKLVEKPTRWFPAVQTPPAWAYGGWRSGQQTNQNPSNLPSVLRRDVTTQKEPPKGITAPLYQLTDFINVIKSWYIDTAPDNKFLLNKDLSQEKIHLSLEYSDTFDEVATTFSEVATENGIEDDDISLFVTDLFYHFVDCSNLTYRVGDLDLVFERENDITSMYDIEENDDVVLVCQLATLIADCYEDLQYQPSQRSLLTQATTIAIATNRALDFKLEDFEAMLEGYGWVG